MWTAAEGPEDWCSFDELTSAGMRMGEQVLEEDVPGLSTWFSGNRNTLVMQTSDSKGLRSVSWHQGCARRAQRSRQRRQEGIRCQEWQELNGL